MPATRAARRTMLSCFWPHLNVTLTSTRSLSAWAIWRLASASSSGDNSMSPRTSYLPEYCVRGRPRCLDGAPLLVVVISFLPGEAGDDQYPLAFRQPFPIQHVSFRLDLE